MKQQKSEQHFLGRFLVRTAAVILLLAFIVPGIILPIAARPLLRSDAAQRGASAVIVLGGDPATRVKPAARAVLDGYGPKLLMVEDESNGLEDEGLIPSESEMTIKLAERAGLPRERIEILKVRGSGRAHSTVDEAITYREYFTRHPPVAKRVIVVTSWPHSSRAGWILDKALSPIGVAVEMMPVERMPYSIDDWWKSESGMIFVFEEYIKWTRYLAKFWARPIPE